jgi:hypothetical protein
MKDRWTGSQRRFRHLDIDGASDSSLDAMLPLGAE